MQLQRTGGMAWEGRGSQHFQTDDWAPVRELEQFQMSPERLPETAAVGGGSPPSQWWDCPQRENHPMREEAPVEGGTALSGAMAMPQSQL